MTDQTTISETDNLTRLLPTCQRCRRLRRKCDTQLPACRLCQKGKAECTFFDHALQQTLPRRLERLKSVQIAVGGDKPVLQLPSFASAQAVLTNPPNYLSTQSLPSSHSDVSFDKHFVIQNANPTCWIFFGSSSPVALSVEVLVHAQTKFGQVCHDQSYVRDEFTFNKQEPEKFSIPRPRPTPSKQEIEALIELYLSTTNILHGYSDSETITRDIDAYLRCHGSYLKNLTGDEAHSFFRVSMICAVAAANRARHHPELASLSVTYYQEGLQCLEEVTSDVSADSLQALLLLILFAFFWPRKVDTWKVLDYACRLSVELNYHTETNDEFEDEKIKQLRRSLFWGLYCLERTIGQHVGRPSDLPEEIITAEYPATLDSFSLLVGSSQYALVSHYYRLIYIRSEIFREVYMPAIAPDLSREWYAQRLDQILTWRHELGGIEQTPGMGTMTCEMGFHTSLCFLFQPLLLRALVATKETSLPIGGSVVIPRESYDAAVRSVAFYNNVYHAEENTPAGRYPITIVSANYIQQASMIILAHCLLAIDGRLPVVTFSSDPVISSPNPIDFQDIGQLTATCLFLLEKVASWFTGMQGMYDIFKNVQEKILPIILQMQRAEPIN